MITSKLSKKNHIPVNISSFTGTGLLEQSTRMEKARRALNPQLKERAAVNVMHVSEHPQGYKVHYLENGFHAKHGIIEMAPLRDHVLETYSSSTEVSDISVFYYIDENRNAVCHSFLESGKEIIAL